MNKLSPRKGPVYYRLENRTHLSDLNGENVPSVDFGGRKPGERRTTRKSADFDDSGQVGHSNHKEPCSDGMLQIINRPSKVRSLPNGTHSSNKLQSSRWKTKLLVLVCSLIIIVGVVLIIHFHETRLETITIGDNSQATAELVLSEKTLKIFDEKRNTRITFSIAGDNLDSIGYKTARKCESEGGGVCLQWSLHNTSLQIFQVQLPDSQVKCFNISWRYAQPYAPVDCFYLDNDESDERRGQPVWYDTIHYILWSRIRTGPCVDSCHSYVPTHSKDHLDIGGTVVEPLWLSSQGSAIKASVHSPLEACLKVCKDVTRSKVCLRRKLDIFEVAERSELSYMACFGSNVSQLQSEMMSKIVIPNSKKVADVLFPKNFITDIKPSTQSLYQRCSPLFEKPLWNIDLNGGGVYNATSVIEGELKDIADIGGTGFLYNISEVYAKIGDFNLHKLTSAKPEDFITAMHRMGFKTMLPLSPFINYDANNFFEASLNGFLLRNKFNEAPVLGEAPALGNSVFPAVIDFTNPDAFQWFVGNIKKFTKTSSVDFIQLLYGQLSWLPGKYHAKYSLSNPAFHSTLFSEVADYLDSCPLTDVAFASQSRCQMVMLKPAGGMEGALRVALASGLAGYPFFIPNLPFRLEEVGMLSSQMLEDGIIRWVQLVSFFPVAHMPWDFHILKNRDIDIARITNMIRKCMGLRNGPIIGPALTLALEKAEKTGHSPIISPIWMAPGLPAASDHDFMTERIYLIENQFMIGCDLMFAPILEMNLTHRTVYFPPGRWASLTDPKMTPIQSDGRLWKKEFPVSLYDVLIFVRKS